MKVHTLKPSESFALGDFYKAQKYKVPGSGHFDKSKCFVLHDNASASAASGAHVGKMATLITMSNRGDSGGRGANGLQLSVPPNGEDGGDGGGSEVSGGETAGVEAQPPPLQSQWLAGVRMVRAPRKFKATPGSDGVVWILRELCVALHSRRRGLGTLLASDAALLSLGPTYCYCIRNYAPVYTSAGFDMLQSTDTVKIEGCSAYQPSSTGKRKNKPELVLMTRGFVVMERTLNDATTTTSGSSPDTSAGRQHGWGQPARGGTEHVQHSGLTVFGVRTKSTAKEIDEQTNLLYGLQVYPQ
eukprot:gene6587-20986_t